MIHYLYIPIERSIYGSSNIAKLGQYTLQVAYFQAQHPHLLHGEADSRTQEAHWSVELLVVRMFDEAVQPQAQLQSQNHPRQLARASFLEQQEVATDQLDLNMDLSLGGALRQPMSSVPTRSVSIQFGTDL